MPWIRGGKCELSANIFNKRRKYLNLVGGIPMPEIVSGSCGFSRALTCTIYTVDRVFFIP